MAETAPARRRRFQFGLRTLFVVVTVFAVWLGWQMKIVNERKAYLHELKLRGRRFELVTEMALAYRELGLDYISAHNLPGPVLIPFWRRWLGDDAVIRISVRNLATDEAEARRLFPEAVIIRDWRAECE